MRAFPAKSRLLRRQLHVNCCTNVVIQNDTKIVLLKFNRFWASVILLGTLTSRFFIIFVLVFALSLLHARLEWAKAKEQNRTKYIRDRPPKTSFVRNVIGFRPPEICVDQMFAAFEGAFYSRCRKDLLYDRFPPQLNSHINFSLIYPVSLYSWPWNSGSFNSSWRFFSVCLKNEQFFRVYYREKKWV